MNKNREFVFELKEVKTRLDEDGEKEEYYVSFTEGTALIDGDDIRIVICDDKQPDGAFVAKDGFFKRLIKKIHDATK